eukprot:gb/GECG01000447.1/.p1 GENE.gb/GECG01000447.1/~~gb/GECG01000447.1/.p1  ORF type:complete len:672 (+),score=95.83 gb/GECG01000447.1/:1-2016(+)
MISRSTLHRRQQTRPQSAKPADTKRDRRHPDRPQSAQTTGAHNGFRGGRRRSSVSSRLSGQKDGVPTIFEEKNGFRKYCQESMKNRRLENARKELVKSPAAKRVLQGVLKGYNTERPQTSEQPRRYFHLFQTQEPSENHEEEENDKPEQQSPRASTEYSSKVQLIDDSSNGWYVDSDEDNFFCSEDEIEEEDHKQRDKQDHVHSVKTNENVPTVASTNPTEEVAYAVLDRYHQWKQATHTNTLNELLPEQTESKPIFDEDSYGFRELCNTLERKPKTKGQFNTVLERTEAHCRRSGMKIAHKRTHRVGTGNGRGGYRYGQSGGNTRELLASMYPGNFDEESKTEWLIAAEMQDEGKNKGKGAHERTDSFVDKTVRQMSRVPTKDWRFYRTYGGAEWRDMNHVPPQKVGYVIPSMIIEGELNAMDHVRQRFTDEQEAETRKKEKIDKRHTEQRNTMLKRIEENRKWDAEILTKRPESKEIDESELEDEDAWWNEYHERVQQAATSPVARQDFRMLELPSPQAVPVSLKKYVTEKREAARPTSAFNFSKKDETQSSSTRPISAHTRMQADHNFDEVKTPPYSPYVVEPKQAQQFYAESLQRPRFMKPLSKDVRQRTLVRGRSGRIPEKFAWATSVPEGFNLLMSDDVAFPKLMKRTEEVLNKKQQKKETTTKN